MKTEFLSGVWLSILLIIFFTVSFAVYLTSGNNAFFLSKKLKIGALILTLTAMTSCDPIGANGPTGGNTCYLPAMTDWLDLDEEGTINLKENNQLNGGLLYRTTDQYSYSFHDSTDSELIRADLIASDGQFDSDYETFVITLDPNMEPGLYFLYFYSVKSSEIEIGEYFREFSLMIEN